MIMNGTNKMNDAQEQNKHKISALFVSFIQPHIVLYDAELIDVCLALHSFAWNMDTFPSENHEEILCELDDEKAASDIRKLAKQKAEFFSYMPVRLTDVKLVKEPEGDFISVTYQGKTDTSPLSPMLVSAKEHMQDTLNQLGELRDEVDELLYSLEEGEITASPEYVTDALYDICLKRSSLRWYRLLLAVWKDQQPHPRVKSVITHWQERIDNMEREFQKCLQLIERMANSIGYDDEEASALADKQIRYAKEIHEHVQKMIEEGGDDEAADALILTTMYDYSDRFKYLLDTADRDQQDALCIRFPGYYRFAKLVEMIAHGISDGTLDVPKGH